MAGVEVQSGSQLAERIQSAAQQKLMDLGWAPEESDTTLSEYVTMMLVNGKDAHGVRAELGGELLGVGEEDAGVGEFTDWLFHQVHSMSGGRAAHHEQDASATTMAPQMQTDDAEDQAMGDAAPVDGAYVPSSSRHGAAGFSFKGAAGIVDPLAHKLTATDSPTGPRSMRNGSDAGRGRGRGGRMLGQMNRNMDRSQDDPLRKIKGAANRIDAHAGRTPRGPRGSNVANGIQRAMNGGRGGHQGMAQMNMMPNGPIGNMNDPQNQLAFMQMMQMQAEMMQQLFANGGQLPNQGGSQKTGRGGKPLFDRMDGKRGGRGGRQQSHASLQNGDAASSGGMDLDKPLTDTSKPKFDSLCRFNMHCTNPNCEFAHQGPANKNPSVIVDMSDTCSYGAKCQNIKCIARHPSPAKRHQYNTMYTAEKSETICRFYPNCANGTACPFKHPDVAPCRNGGDCQDSNCSYAHSSITCRYNPCTVPSCRFKHTEGQRGTYKDKIWTAEGGEPLNGSKTDRFAELAGTDGQGAEVILPGRQENGDGANGMSDIKAEHEDLVT
ncbi:nuclear polyadenylated rna-binding protein nab2 [Teratosphaeria destructans]|uniref:Nuclear polyadenylated rna-binding protein nab2 n=1 Tax=Teratosphaeria destructans TaxID=418781 RepID=A0A9W7SNB0_9PEZI|nr:nuclear polyadenylated rna-binding protein nab2 [Teratosphaeria destructans]